MNDNEIVARISKLAGDANACNIQRDAEGKVACRDGTPCCSGCKHLAKDGCTVSAHGCRMWFCWAAWHHMPIIIQVEIYELMLKYKADVWFRHDAWNMGKIAKGIPQFNHEVPNIPRLLFQHP